jgi:hypothetical protein
VDHCYGTIRAPQHWPCDAPALLAAWLAVYLTCFWMGQAMMSSAPSDPGLAMVDDEYVTCAGYAAVSSTMTEARLQHAQITNEKTAAPAAIKMSPPMAGQNPAGLCTFL